MKVLATIYKEYLTLLRDPGGMALIFLMPVVLVTVMSIVQDAPFKDYTQLRFDIICVNDDHDSLGAWVEHSLETSGSFHLVKDYHNRPVTIELAQSLVDNGDYKAAVYIPSLATRRISRKTVAIVQTLMSGFGLTEKPHNTNDSVVNIQLLFDPVIQANMRQSLLFGVEKIVAGAENKLLMQKFADQIKSISGDSTLDMSHADISNAVIVTGQKKSLGFDNGAMNSVQHNVPAWAMFAMFFIVFPLAGNFIKEREDGSLLRLRLISGSQFYFIAGKYLFYFLVCLIQFVLMMTVGLFLLPLLGLPTLLVGDKILFISIAAICISMAATAYGMLVATAFRTHHQALAFGSVSVVLLAAIGGVWVPVYILPHGMQAISHFSPLSWGLNLCNDIFLRHSSITALMPDILRLLSFTVVCLVLSYYSHARRIIK